AGSLALEVLLQAGVRAVQSTPLISSAGHLLGMLSTHFGQPHRPGERELRLVDLLARQASDILERKQAEQSLRESEDRFRTLASHAPVGIFTSNLKGESLFVNGAWCAMTGLKPEEALGQGWLKAVYPEDREPL